jgi:hypothetical protein
LLIPLQGYALGYFPPNVSAAWDPYAFSCTDLYTLPVQNDDDDSSDAVEPKTSCLSQSDVRMSSGFDVYECGVVYLI